MKKLLFFITTLFGILSMQSFSWNYGCGENIPPHICGADGSSGNSVSSGPGVDNYIGAIAINKNTGYWTAVSEYTNKKEAVDTVSSKCGAECEIIYVQPERCTGLAYSASNKIIGYDSAKHLMSIGANTRVKRSNDKALKKCQKNGGTNCKLLVNVCAIGGITKY